jgi:hypothetical protein
VTFVPAALNSFNQGSDRAGYVACPEGQQITIINQGNTLYYKTTSDVTSASSDGTIASAASASFTTGQYVITAQGVSTSVLVKQTEGVTGNVRVGGNETVAGTETVTGAATSTGAATLTGGIVPPAAPHGFPNWQPIAATSGTDTAFVNGTLFLSSIFIPVNKTLTGVGFLLGSVGGTDRVVVNLWSTAGVNLAQSTTTSSGTVAGTAANTQEIAFTAQYAAVGPALYYVGVAGNTGTAKLRTVPAFTNAGIYAGSVSQTHGATTTLTVPTTFTADKAPVAYVY